MNDDDRYTLRMCRVCGLEYDEPTWGATYVYEYCYCCGVQFSYGDATPDAARKWRDRWLAEGAPWTDSERRPNDWDVDKQTARVPEGWR
jgi:hypothetical protein